MTTPFSNMEDIVYCHNEVIAEEIFSFLISKGYQVGMSGSQIETGTHGEQFVKRIDIFKKEKS